MKGGNGANSVSAVTLPRRLIEGKSAFNIPLPLYH